MGKIKNETVVVPTGEDKLLGSNFGGAETGDTVNVTVDSIDEYFMGKRIANVPSSASDTGIAGQIAIDGSYTYLCTATDTWMRAAIATW